MLAGPLAGPLLAAGSCAAVAVVTRRLRAVLPVAALTLVMLVSWVSYWFFWGKAFEAADAVRDVPGEVELASDVAMATCAVSAIAVTTVAFVVVSRRLRWRSVEAPPGAAA